MNSTTTSSPIRPFFVTTATLVLLCLSLTACLKKNYDAPPDTSGYDPMLKVDLTIAELKQMNGAYDFHTGGDTSLITKDITIAGIVTANDRSGNLYNQLVIEDTSGAITINIDATNLYNDYPVGRRIYVKCKGLTLGYDGGLPVLGYYPDAQLLPSGIPLSGLKEYIITGATGHTVNPKVLTLPEAKNAADDPDLYSRLVVITDAQFEDTSVSYAQPNGATSRELIDCSSSDERLAVRTSNYASFANIPLPKGKGKVTGIFTVFVSATNGSRTPQLVLRDTIDVSFTSPRCTGVSNQPVAVISIDSLRKLYQGAGTKLGSYAIKGVVISDALNKNISSGSVVLQDGDKGVTVYWGGSVSYNVGDSLLIDVTGDSLLMFQGALEVKRSSSAKPVPLATGKTVLPYQLTIAQLNAEFPKYESTLVKIVNANVIGGGSYSGSKTLVDGTGSITLYTLSTALFASQPVPAGTKSFVGIATPFTGGVKELKLRDPASDVY
jgi:hypothetical protein